MQHEIYSYIPLTFVEDSMQQIVDQMVVVCSFYRWINDIEFLTSKSALGFEIMFVWTFCKKISIFFLLDTQRRQMPYNNVSWTISLSAHTHTHIHTSCALCIVQSFSYLFHGVQFRTAVLIIRYHVLVCMYSHMLVCMYATTHTCCNAKKNSAINLII